MTVAGPYHRAVYVMHSAVSGSEFMMSSGMLARVTSKPLSQTVPSVSNPADFRTADLIPVTDVQSHRSLTSS